MVNINRQEIEDRRTDILYAVSVHTGIILIIASLVIVFLFYNKLHQYPVYDSILYIWLPFALISFIIKIALAVYYNMNKIKNKKLWQRFFYFTTIMSGVVFGSYLFFLRQIDNDIYIFFTFLLIATLVAGSTGVLSANIAAFSVFFMLSLLPYSAYFIFIMKDEYTPIGIFILIFISTNFFNARRLNKLINRSIRLSIENELIIDKLAQSEQKFSKSFYSGIAPMAMLNFNNARFIDANDAMLDLIEYSRDAIIGKTPYDLELYRKPEDAIDLITEAYNKKHLANREITLITGSGKKLHCLVTVENFMLNDSIIALVMLQDFTERLEYEKQLEIERDRAETAASVKDRFLATMSHEIRTPMTAILGMTNLAMHTEDPNEREEYLKVVKDSGNFLLGLIDDILDMLKLQAEKIDIDPVDMDINEVAESVYRTMELLVLSKRLTFTKKINPEVPRYIKSSPERLKQILINLTGNAIKFTHEGGITIEISLSDGNGYNRRTGTDRFIEFAVTDTGIGIPFEQQQLVFETFTQADPAIFRKYGGTGLGLTICRQLLKLLKGDIKVQSEPLKGSRFSFIIPLIPGDKAALEDIKPYLQPEPEKHKKILFAEDNIMNQKLMKAYMKKLGHSFVLAETGFEVIKKLQQEEFDLVLMDIEMPEMNGYEAMKRIRTGEAGDKNSDIPIFAMSAHVQKETINKCIEDGFTGYLIKPLDLKYFREIL